MKFLGVAVVVVALYLSWNWFSGEGVVVPESIHSQIQQSLSKEIVDIIAESNSEAYNIEVLDFWTETKDETTIEAHFKFAFEEGTGAEATKVIKKGRALLVRSKEKSEYQFWTAQEVTLEGQKIEFKEGLNFPEQELDEALEN